MTVALKNKSWSTESQFSSRNRGVTWSNFLVLVTILQAKFCTSCNFLMLVVEVLDHTVEQYSIFKTIDDINCSRVLPSKLFFTRLIWHGFAIQEDTTLEICQSYVRWESRVTSKSFADAIGSKDLSRKDTTGEEENLLLSCLVAMSINLVLSGFINSWFSQHQAATRSRSCSRFAIAVSTSGKEKDRKTLESSTYDSRPHTWGVQGRSFR